MSKNEKGDPNFWTKLYIFCHSVAVSPSRRRSSRAKLDMQGGEFIESDTAATNFVILARNCFHRFLQPNQGRTAVLKGIQKD